MSAISHQFSEEDFNFLLDSDSEMIQENFVTVNCDISSDIPLMSQQIITDKNQSHDSKDSSLEFLSENNEVNKDEAKQNETLKKKKLLKKSHQLSLEQRKVNSRRYRERKKLALIKLMNQNKRYREMIEEQSKKILELQHELHSYKYLKSKEKVNFEKQEFAAAKLLMNQKDQVDQEGLLNMVQSVKARYGPAGNDRREVLNYLMSEFMDNSLQDMQKCVIMYSLKSSGYLRNISSNCCDMIENKINLQKEELQKLKGTVTGQVAQEASKYMKISKTIYKLYVSLIAQAEKMQRVIHCAAGQFLKPMLKAMEWFTKNQYSLEISKIKQDWLMALRQNDFQEEESSQK